MKLTLKQKKFVDFYIKLGNATEAAIEAGYSKKTARFIGQENLTKPNIRKLLDERISQKEKERIASQDEVLEFLTKVLRNQETEEVPVSMTNKFELVDKKPSIKDRTKAAELLGKRYALFKDNVNLNGDHGLNIQIDYGDDEDD